MKNLPKENIFKVPENYFENLSDQIIKKKSDHKSKIIYIRSIVTAAVVLLTVSLFVLRQEINATDAFQTSMSDEISLYINAGYWGAEDVLSLTENPDYILDQIIIEEWGMYNVKEIEYEDDMWY